MFSIGLNSIPDSRKNKKSEKGRQLAVLSALCTMLLGNPHVAQTHAVYEAENYWNYCTCTT